MGVLIGRDPSTVYNASEGKKFNAETTLEVVTCPTCGIIYAIPDGLAASARRWHGDRSDGWKITCPLGHTWWYVGKTDLERAQEQLDTARNRAARMSAQAQQARAATRAERAAKTRFKNQRDRERTRVAAGVCPECNRTFQNLARHMNSQHPHHAHDDH